MDENELTAAINSVGYKMKKKTKDTLPNGKSLVRVDYEIWNSDLVDSESRKHRENRAFMGMIRIVSLM